MPAQRHLAEYSAALRVKGHFQREQGSIHSFLSDASYKVPLKVLIVTQETIQGEIWKSEQGRQIVQEPQIWVDNRLHAFLLKGRRQQCASYILRCIKRLKLTAGVLGDSLDLSESTCWSPSLVLYYLEVDPLEVNHFGWGHERNSHDKHMFGQEKEDALKHLPTCMEHTRRRWPSSSQEENPHWNPLVVALLPDV